jgi:phospholipase/carboxylesterase
MPGDKCPPLIISHGLFDDVVPIDASRAIYERVKSKSSEFCELLEFDGLHQIDSNLIKFISSNISNIL